MNQKFQDYIFSHHEMCSIEGKMLQQGMNFRANTSYSIVLMSQKSNAPYMDRIHDDGVTIEYEGHDVPKNHCDNPKQEDQAIYLPSGTLTQNGRFVQAIEEYKKGMRAPEPVKVYEKIINGVWSLKGIFDLIDYKIVNDGKRNVFRFILRLSQNQKVTSTTEITLSRTRLIPSEVKVKVWKRDGGKCVLCGSKENLHFDHDLPFSRGGTSLSEKNVKLLCVKHNLSKSNKIE